MLCCCRSEQRGCHGHELVIQALINQLLPEETPEPVPGLVNVWSVVPYNEPISSYRGKIRGSGGECGGTIHPRKCGGPGCLHPDGIRILETYNFIGCARTTRLGRAAGGSSVGAGDGRGGRRQKHRVANEVSYLLSSAGVPHALIDFDALTACYPCSPGDRFGNGLGWANLAGVWRNWPARWNRLR